MAERSPRLTTDALTRAQLVTELARARADTADLQQRLASSEQAARSVEAQLSLLHQAIEKLPIGFVLADPSSMELLNNGHHQVFGEPDATSVSQLTPAGEDGTAPLHDAAMSENRRLRQTVDGRDIQIEIQRFGDGYEVAALTDVTALRAAEQRLEDALRKESADNRAKSIFLANMSHELRTPLNAIVGYAEFLMTDTGRSMSEEKKTQYLGDIVFASRHLSAIINDILDLSSAETGQYRITLGDVPVRENLERVQRMFAARAAEKQVRLIIGGPDDDQTVVRADQRALNQMLINLVANSLRYTSANGAIVLESRMLANGLDILVRDTGAGIAAEEIDSVLRPFQRGSNPGIADSGAGDNGIGLGLALTRELMDSHGGTLRLESKVGQGTVVTLHFPATT